MHDELTLPQNNEMVESDQVQGMLARIMDFEINAIDMVRQVNWHRYWN